ncbi:baseplate J/gp47 family protein [Pseudoalteromonas luteoviolacea]|uniref:baseplate assembly protein n=1 Tax=Pseudoalteromonas luteoviolacea TaxID=43657 RepID=UPI0031BAD1E2|nr:baseplate J/gp47 family protein [Pseudoalteromonas luteoviolacea]
MSTAIELAKLPPPQVIEALSYDEIYKQMEQALLDKLPDHALLASDPAIKLIEVASYRELLLRQRINDAAKSVMLAFSQGSDLDNLGALFGIGRAENEGDERYRQRIPLSLESYSMAGTKGAYEYHTFSANDKVRDVYVDSDSPGYVNIYALIDTMTQSQANEIKADIDDRLNDEDIRPITDKVVTQWVMPTIETLSAQIYLNIGANKQQVELAIMQALDAFIAEHCKLGSEIPHSGIIDALHQPGVRKVKLLTPTEDLQPAVNQAYSLDINLQFPDEA